MLGLVVLVLNWSSGRLQNLGSIIGRDGFRTEVVAGR